MGTVEKTIGVGVVGINMGADTLEVNNDPNSRFVVRGLCSATGAKVKALAQRWGIDLATTDYRNLLNRDDIQVMAIYSPDDLHYEHVVASLNAGKHVVVTKPMVTAIEHAREIAVLARKTGLKVLVGQTMRFQPEFMNVKKLMDDGNLGEILFAQAHYLHDMRPVFAKTPWRMTESVMNYMKHFEACLTEDREPSPNAEDAFKSLSISVAGWESIRTGKPARICNEIQ